MQVSNLQSETLIKKRHQYRCFLWYGQHFLHVCKNWTVVIYAATWATFKLKLEKIKKSTPKKKFFIFQEMDFSCPPKKLISLIKNLIKLFYTLKKAPLGNWMLEQPLFFSGRSSIQFFNLFLRLTSNLYYLLAAQVSSFLIHF